MSDRSDTAKVLTTLLALLICTAIVPIVLQFKLAQRELQLEFVNAIMPYVAIAVLILAAIISAIAIADIMRTKLGERKRDKK